MKRTNNIKSFNLEISYNTIVYFILFLFSINFMNKSGYIFLLIPLLLFFLKGIPKNLKVNKNFFYLLMYCIFYSIIYVIKVNSSFKNIIYFFIGPVFSFLIGRKLIKDTNIEKSEEKLCKLILLLSTGMFMHGFLNMISTVSTYGIFSNQRVAIDFWRGDLISATGQGIFFTMIISILPAFILEYKKVNCQKLLVLIASLISIFSTLEMANRTLLVIVVLVAAFSLILYLILNKFKLRKLIKLLVIFIFITITLFIIYEKNFYGIKEYIDNSPLILRLQNTENFMDTSRTDIIKDFFKQWYYHPFGGYEILMLNKFKWTHNLWLDTYCATGFIPFVCIIIYTVATAKDLVKFIYMKNITKFLKILVFGLYVGIVLNFNVEPILENNPYFFMMFVMINGAINAILYNNRKGC